MDGLGIVGHQWGMFSIHYSINSHLEQVAIGGNYEGDTNTLVITLDIQLTTVKVTQETSHLSNITIVIEDFSSKQDHFCAVIEIVNRTGKFW